MLSDRRGLLLVLATYFVLAICYGLVNPLFEAPDEHSHFFTVQTIADEGRLPRVEAEPDTFMGQEAAQPPLYYLLGAALIWPVETGQAREAVWPNPHVNLGDASVPTNRNAFVHGPEESWPWRGYVLAGHLLRLFSTVLGAGTLLCIYAAGRLLWPDAPARALLAAAMVAFLPQFLFLHASISNDSLIIFLSSAALLQLIWLWQRGPRTARLLLLGVTIGLAVLSKTAGLLLLGYVCAVLTWRWRRVARRQLATRLITVVTPAVLVGGWLPLRNWLLYGDPTAANQFVQIMGGDRAYTVWQVLAETPGLWRSLFAVFGWFNIAAPAWVYLLWSALALFAVAGLIYARLQGGSRSVSALALLLAAWPLLVYLGLFSFMLRTPAAQGRLLFPALLPLALGLAFGLDQWPWPILRRAAPLLALLSAVYCLAFVIPPAYARPTSVDAAQIPAGATWLNAELAEGIELVAASAPRQQLRPGETIWMTLYWRITEQTAEAPEFVVELFAREQRLVGRLHSYHGGGNYPANLWPENVIVADTIGVVVQEEAMAPAVVDAFVGIVGYERRISLGAIAKITPVNWPRAGSATLATLGGAIELLEAKASPAELPPGGALRVDITWRALAAPPAAWTTFLHLGDPEAPPLAVGDRPPRKGAYPTDWWEAGEVITDQYELEIPADLPSGRYALHLGMYDAATGERMPLTIGDVRQPHDAYRVGWVTIRDRD